MWVIYMRHLCPRNRPQDHPGTDGSLWVWWRRTIVTHPQGGGVPSGRGSGWRTHVNPWLFHFNVWQNPPQIKKKKKPSGRGFAKCYPCPRARAVHCSLGGGMRTMTLRGSSRLKNNAASSLTGYGLEHRCLGHQGSLLPSGRESVLRGLL